MEWYLKVWRNYAVFNGRARRKEYWMFFLFNILVSIVLGIIEAILGNRALSTLYELAILLPGLAVSVRRLHDTGRSGWWIFINLVPIVGSIVYLVFMCLEGEGDNRFGPDPKTFEFGDAGKW